MIKFFLDFENEIAQIESRINELRHLSTGKTVKILDEITDLEFKANKMLKEKYANLTPWQRVQVARHPDRPHSLDYIDNLFSDLKKNVPLSFEIEEKIWEIWSTHPSDKNLTEMLAKGSNLMDNQRPVSYTHLTLPTIRTV